MKVKTLQILWHDKQPLFTADFDPLTQKLATGGADANIRVRFTFSRLVALENPAESPRSNCSNRISLHPQETLGARQLCPLVARA